MKARPHILSKIALAATLALFLVIGCQKNSDDRSIEPTPMQSSASGLRLADDSQFTDFIIAEAKFTFKLKQAISKLSEGERKRLVELHDDSASYNAAIADLVRSSNLTNEAQALKELGTNAVRHLRKVSGQSTIPREEFMALFEAAFREASRTARIALRDCEQDYYTCLSKVAYIYGGTIGICELAYPDPADCIENASFAYLAGASWCVLALYTCNGSGPS